MKKVYNIPKVKVVEVESNFRPERVVTHAIDIGEAIRTNTLGSHNSSLLRRGLAEDTAEIPEYIENFGVILDEIVDESNDDSDDE